MEGLPGHKKKTKRAASVGALAAVGRSVSRGRSQGNCTNKSSNSAGSRRSFTKDKLLKSLLNCNQGTISSDCSLAKKIGISDDAWTKLWHTGYSSSPHEMSEVEKLLPCQMKALVGVRQRSQILHERALPKLKERISKLGFDLLDLQSVLAWIRDEAPIIIHVDLGRFAAKMAQDSHYRSLFETGVGNGNDTRQQRSVWEDRLFAGHYDKSLPFDRCKYGVLNVTNDPQGVRACSRYGSSYFLLRGVRLRTTFSAKDSASLRRDDLATVDHYAHVLCGYDDKELKATLEVGSRRLLGVDSNTITQYKEAQIHGEIRFAEHVELIMVDSKLREMPGAIKNLQRLASRCNANVVWMEGDGPTLPSAPILCSSPHPPLVSAPSHDCDDAYETLAQAIEPSYQGDKSSSGLAAEYDALAQAIEASLCTAQAHPVHSIQASWQGNESSVGSASEDEALAQAMKASLRNDADVDLETAIAASLEADDKQTQRHIQQMARIKYFCHHGKMHITSLPLALTELSAEDAKLAHKIEEARDKDTAPSASGKPGPAALVRGLTLKYADEDGNGLKLCLQALHTYLFNVANCPDVEKFQRISLHNKAFCTRVVPYEGAVMLLKSVGFDEDAVADELVYNGLGSNKHFVLWDTLAMLKVALGPL